MNSQKNKQFPYDFHLSTDENELGDSRIVPAGPQNCPPGLEYLTTVDQLLVQQKVELLNSKYLIKNSLGQQIYTATRSMIDFDMKIVDNHKNEVIHVNRPLPDCCCFYFLKSLEISAPPGTVIGSVEQQTTFFTPLLHVKNDVGDTVLQIEGPAVTFSLGDDVEFRVLSLTGEQVGRISKQWSGLAREWFTDADFFGVSFPMDLDVKLKAVLLGATFLIDDIYFNN